TQLDGAVIASEGNAEKNRLDTGTLGFKNIENKAEYRVEHQGGSLSTGGGVGGNLISNMGSALAMGGIKRKAAITPRMQQSLTVNGLSGIQNIRRRMWRR
ncbi:hypothetical protein B6P79_003341, partial [Escherichia coli]|nr:hypothetical protein [Escherichia coli]